MSDFYDRVFKECEVFFGTGTERFLNRQIEGHLGKKPDNLESGDKQALAKWIRISAGLLLKREDVEKLTEKILSL